MYSYDGVRNAENIKRLADGTIQCGNSHYGAYYYPQARKTATTVFAVVDAVPSVQYLMFACPKHAGSIKTQITKATWQGRDTRWLVGLTPEGVAKDVPAAIAAVEQEMQLAHRVEKAEQEMAALDYARAGWAEARHAYNTRNNEQTATLIGADEFGCVFIRANGQNRMTPTEARALAEALVVAAGDADDRTAFAVKP